MRFWFRLTRFVSHWFCALRHTYGFGVQAPFAFDLLKDALRNRNRYYVFNILELKRRELLESTRKINVEDFGARGYRSYEASIGEVLVQSVKRKRQQELLFRLVEFMHAKNILELGTSLGLTSAYLASVNSNSQVVTIEASHDVAGEASKLWKSLNLKNITLVEEEFNTALSRVLPIMKEVDFVFIDGNHRGQALVDYFNQILPYCCEKAIIVADDIYWSKDMLSGWRNIKKHPSVQISFNLFHMGILIVNAPTLSPGKYRVLV